ncbi:uncharacterized protein LOC117177649 [Belonocnema kinseyi]|uniref:uncharacterized protein LOC117177649 n=1 Tax=Belonocnema kinseyi TaxID=2817044 RepID=UPI00143CFFF2|nr:uncharacterized protein LOC117177649 [Belonocnema kinseyi]
MQKTDISEIRWVVRNVKLLWSEKISLISPIFDVNEVSHPHSRRLIITRTVAPDTEEETIEGLQKSPEKGYMSLYLQNLFFKNCSNMRDTLSVTFSLIHPIRGEILSQSEIQFDACSGNLFGLERFVSMETLAEYGFDFTIICKFRKLWQDFKTYAKFFKQQISSDINLLIVDEIQTFPAHKLVLALGSYHFQKLFENKKSISWLAIEKMKLEVATEMLRYIYTGEAIYTKKLIHELFRASMKYEVRGLRSSCQKFLVQNLNVENLVPTLLSCSGYFLYHVDFLNQLILACMRLIVENLDEVVKLDVCKELIGKEPQILTEIIAHLSTSNVLTDSSTEEDSVCSQVSQKRFERFVNSSDFSDIIIQVNDLKYPAHKVILAASSPVFNVMFSHNMKETICGVVKIEDIRPEVFETLLKFIYTDEIESQDDFMPEILIASDKYEINDLKWECENILGEKLTSDNVIATLIFAADHNAERLKKKCLRFITHANSPFWSNSLNYFNIPKQKLNINLTKSHPHLLYDMLKEIHENKFS